jgi:transcription factor IIIB subunit 2
LPVVDPSVFIHRFALSLELGDKTHEVQMTANRLVQLMKRDWIQQGRSPAGFLILSCDFYLFIFFS